MPTADTVLAGLPVIDLSEGVAGPFCARLLTDFGADVIKLELPGEGDITRSWGPFPGDEPHPERSGLFSYLNAGKLGATLNVETESGLKLLRNLARQSKVLVEDGRLGRRFGAAVYEDLLATNPALSILSITPFGLTGPYADYPATELTTMAIGGYLYLCGDPDREPLKPHGWLAEYQTGYSAALVALAVVMQAETTGRGEVVDIAVLDSVNFLLGDVPSEERFQHVRHIRNGSRNTTPNPVASYPSTMLPTRDGYVHVHFGAPNALGEFLDLPALNQPPLSTRPKENADAIDTLITSWLEDRNKIDAAFAAQSEGMAFTPVLNPLELLNDPQHLETGFLMSTALPDGQVFMAPGPPFRLSDACPPMDGSIRAPRLGEHNEVVWADRAGLDPTELRDYNRLGVI